MLTASGSLIWSNTTSTTNTIKGSQTATALIGCSSLAWAGPKTVDAFYDNVYGTFLFVLDDHSTEVEILHGHIYNQVSGAAIYGVPVKLTQEGSGAPTYQTATDNRGNYAFYSPVDRPAGIPLGTLSVGGINRLVPIGRSHTPRMSRSPNRRRSLTWRRHHDPRGRQISLWR